MKQEITTLANTVQKTFTFIVTILANTSWIAVVAINDCSDPAIRDPRTPKKYLTPTHSADSQQAAHSLPLASAGPLVPTPQTALPTLQTHRSHPTY
jgi:hypothetical protein